MSDDERTPSGALGADQQRGHDEIAALRGELEASRRVVVELERQARSTRDELERFRNSAAGRMAVRLQNVARRVAPLGTVRQRALHHFGQYLAALIEGGPPALLQRSRRLRAARSAASGHDDTPVGRRGQYEEWRRRHEPDRERLQRMGEDNRTWNFRPLVSVVMPVCDPDPAWLDGAITSVTDQNYEHWELCIADDASIQPLIGDLLRRAAANDQRTKIIFRDVRGGIARASNDAIRLATGEFVVFLDHDDLLKPHAIHKMVEVLQRSPRTDVVYSDEDKLLPAGSFGDPFFKPDLSPDLLLSCNYITHLVMVRRTLLDTLGGIREGFNGSQDHDLLLRVTEKATRVEHVSEVLYSWRMVPGSAALSSDYKPLAREAGRRAVQDALSRRGISGRVEFGASPGLYNVRYTIHAQPLVRIVIPTRDQVGLLAACIDSIEKFSTYPRYAITIADNGSRDPRTLNYLRATNHDVVGVAGAFNFSTIVNRAAAAADGDHLLLLNNDIVVITPDWIEAMLEHSQRPEIAAVGARLLYPDGHVQHEGIVVGRLHVAANVNMGWRVVREVSAVTGACLMTRRAVFDELGGFDEKLAEAFNDVDYCLRARSKGYRILFTPLACLRHREGATRGRRTPVTDRDVFVSRWGGPDEIEDPFLNPNVLWPNPLRLRLD